MARTLTEWVCLLQISSDITGCDYNMERMWPRGGTEHNVLNFNRTQTTISWSSDPSEINRETSHVSSSSSTYLDTHSPLWLRLNCFAFVWSGGSFVYQRTGTSGNRSKGKIFALGPITIMLLQVSVAVHEPRVSIIMEISRWRAALPCGINSLSGTRVRPNLRHTADFILQPTEN